MYKLVIEAELLVDYLFSDEAETILKQIVGDIKEELSAQFIPSKINTRIEEINETQIRI